MGVVDHTVSCLKFPAYLLFIFSICVWVFNFSVTVIVALLKSMIMIFYYISNYHIPYLHSKDEYLSF